MKNLKASAFDRPLAACKNYCGEHLLAVIAPLPEDMKMRILDFWLRANL